MRMITVKFLPCTNFKGSRLIADDGVNRVTIGYPHEVGGGNDKVKFEAARQWQPNTSIGATALLWRAATIGSRVQRASLGSALPQIWRCSNSWQWLRVWFLLLTHEHRSFNHHDLG